MHAHFSIADSSRNFGQVVHAKPSAKAQLVQAVVQALRNQGRHASVLRVLLLVREEVPVPRAARRRPQRRLALLDRAALRHGEGCEGDLDEL